MAKTRRELLEEVFGLSSPSTQGPSRRYVTPRDTSSATTSQATSVPGLPDVLPKHAGAHPDDPALPAVDPLVVLLNRCSYGIRAEDWAEAQSLGFNGWVERQLNHLALDSSAVESQIAANLPRVGWSYAELLNDARATGRNGTAFGELVTATLARQLLSPRQLFEVMVEFWSDHFNVTAEPVPEVYFLVADNRDVMRTHALGKFPDLLRANARSLSMLFYLDNAFSRASGPNENYARELLELHTLGIDGGYSERDISEVARCFTGWTVTGFSNGTPAFSFVPSLHDNGSKQVLGTTISAGGGISDGERVLDLLASHPSTARHIAHKLCIRFIADVPQDSVVDAVAATYRLTGGDIKAMLRTLFASEEFKSAYDRKIKRPLEYLLSSLRATDATIASNTSTAIVSRLTAMGHVMQRWPTPDGYPDSIAEWLSSGAMLARWNWAFSVAEDRAGGGIRLNIPALIGSAQTPAALVDTLSARLLKRQLSTADRNRLIAFAANGGSAQAVMTGTTLQTRARELIGSLLASSYFQYR